MEVSEHNIISVTTNRGVIQPKIVINAAGVFAEDIAAMADDRFFSIHPRRGTNSILDLSLIHISPQRGGFQQKIADEQKRKGRNSKICRIADK